LGPLDGLAVLHVGVWGVGDLILGFCVWCTWWWEVWVLVCVGFSYFKVHSFVRWDVSLGEGEKSTSIFLDSGVGSGARSHTPSNPNQNPL